VRDAASTAGPCFGPSTKTSELSLRASISYSAEFARVPDINSYVLSAAGELFSFSLSTAEFLPDGTGTLMRVTEHGAYFDGNPEGPKIRVHGIGTRGFLLVLPMNSEFTAATERAKAL
jgi:hypothetical protein